MDLRYTDTEIQRLWNLPKVVENPRAPWTRRQNYAHMKRTYNVRGAPKDRPEYLFEVYQRRSIHDENNYSCGIIYLPKDKAKLTLARYNGANHIHKDTRGIIKYKPHIHKATEEAIVARRKPEYFAKETIRYNSLHGAFLCLLEDFNLPRFNPIHYMGSLFDGTDS